MCKAFDWGPYLDEAIEHWERVVTSEDTLITSMECALCTAYSRAPELAEAGFCEGCPVYVKTRHMACEGSPYDEIISHLHKAHRGFTNTKIHCDKCEECARLAKKQVEFLKGLRAVEAK